jgi:hypothetical protein
MSLQCNRQRNGWRDLLNIETLGVSVAVTLFAAITATLTVMAMQP